MLISLVIAAAKVVQIERITKEKALKTIAEAIFSMFNVQCSMIFRTFALIMIVCIAEKPSVARDIARIIGATTSHDGYMEGNGFQVTWTFGHLCTLKEPHDYTSAWRAWSLTSHP